MENKEIAKRQLPKLDDLYGDIELASKFNELNKLLNSPPKPEWVQVNPMANNSQYLPVERVEYLLTTIYTKWKVEIKSIQVIANSVVVAIRLFVLDPITGEWDWNDGAGGCPMQTKKGAGAMDWMQINNAAVQMATPAAESFALKDAAEKFGKIFGKDLNRKDQINYAPMQDAKFSDNGKQEIPQELIDIIEWKETVEELTEIYKANPEYHSNPKFMQILNKRKQELKNGSTINAQ